jgi:hypothetical protein
LSIEDLNACREQSVHVFHKVLYSLVVGGYQELMYRKIVVDAVLRKGRDGRLDGRGHGFTDQYQQ